MALRTVPHPKDAAKQPPQRTHPLANYCHSRGWGGAPAISTLRQFVIAKHLAQTGLHDLARSGMGHFIEHCHVIRKHPVWKPLCEERNDIIALRMALRPRRYDQQWPFGPAGMGYGDYRRLGDIGMC